MIFFETHMDPQEIVKNFSCGRGLESLPLPVRMMMMMLDSQ